MNRGEKVKFDMSQFDSYREDNRREVKKAQGGLPTSLWETYSAFANCYGGVIILGVKENKDGSWYMTGLDNAAKLRKDFLDTINNKNKVSVNLLTDFLCLEKNIRFYMNFLSIFWTIGKFLIRQSDGRTDCNPVQVTGREIYLISSSAFIENL